MDDRARPVVHWSSTPAGPERQRAFYGERFNWPIGDGPVMDVPAGLGGPEPARAATSGPVTAAA